MRPLAFSPISLQIASRQPVTRPVRDLASIGGAIATGIVALVCLYIVCVGVQRIANGTANIAPYPVPHHIDCTAPAQWFIDRCVTSTGFAHLKGQ